MFVTTNMHNQLAVRSNVSEYLNHFFPDVLLFLQHFLQVNEWHSQKMEIFTVCIYETENWSLIRYNSLVGETAEHN